MPGSTGSHSRAFYQNNEIATLLCIFEHTKVAVKMIKGDVENALHYERKAM
jgi:hypothetical protein